MCSDITKSAKISSYPSSMNTFLMSWSLEKSGDFWKNARRRILLPSFWSTIPEIQKQEEVFKDLNISPRKGLWCIVDWPHIRQYFRHSTATMCWSSSWTWLIKWTRIIFILIDFLLLLDFAWIQYLQKNYKIIQYLG